VKTRRNDPCPCGSGKKFKHCCASAEAFEQQREQGHAGAVERALDWLAARHAKATGAEIEAMLFEGLSDEERNALQQADDETWEQLQRNALEWLLAEGAIGEGRWKAAASIARSLALLPRPHGNDSDAWPLLRELTRP
jgi:hypothetical protein